MIALRLVWRMLVRDWRAGELGVLAAALFIAVAALTAVAALADRVEQGLRLQAHQVLGGDLLLAADHPWSDEFRRQATQRGLRLAESATLMSMAMTGGAAHLVDIKAVGVGYPLRGALRTSTAPGSSDSEASGPPARGSAWVVESLAAAGLLPLQIGNLHLDARAILTLDPERGMAAFALAPRVIIHLDDLMASGLVQPGSRIGWRLHIAGDAASVADYRDWAAAHLGRGERLETIDNARPEMQTLVERAQRFLRLAALLTLVLAAVAIGLATDRYLRRHLDACAVMRCLGASSRTLLIVHGGEFLLLTLIATGVGCLAGVLLQQALLALLGGLLVTDLPAVSWQVALQGGAVGLVLAGGFLLPPLLSLHRVATVRVLRREMSVGEPRRLLGYLFGLALLAALVIWLAGGWRLGLIVLAGFAVTVIVVIAAAYGMLAGLRRLARNLGPAWRLGLIGLQRRRQAAVVQVAALAIGITALLVLTVARDDLLTSWRNRLPDDAPNRFIINLQAEQRPDFARFFSERGLPPPRVEPMVRARLTAVNGRPVADQTYADERARRLVEREFNLSWTTQIPDGNSISQGRWFGEDGVLQFSVEQGLAETLGLHVGDRLSYQLGGETLTGAITSLRKLEWNSMRVNFFVIMPPMALQHGQASFITSFYLPPAALGFTNDLSRAFPNLTVIDVGMVLKQLQDTLDQVARAVAALFGLSLVAGLIVLYAGIEASADQRRRELALMRALGGRRRQLRRAMAAEFVTLGAASGLLAGCAAAGIAWALGRWVFHLAYLPTPWLPLAGGITGAVGVAAVGLLLTRDILVRPLSADLWTAD